MQDSMHWERARLACRAVRPRAAHRAATRIRNALGRRVYSASARNMARAAHALPNHAALLSQPIFPVSSVLKVGISQEDGTGILPDVNSAGRKQEGKQPRNAGLATETGWLFVHEFVQDHSSPAVMEQLG